MFRSMTSAVFVAGTRSSAVAAGDHDLPIEHYRPVQQKMMEAKRTQE